MVSELQRSETLKREFGTGAVLARHTILQPSAWSPARRQAKSLRMWFKDISPEQI